MRYALRGLLLVLLVCVVGCAAKGPSFFQIERNIPEIPAGHGRLFFLNPVREHARLFIDKRKIGECKYGAFFWEDVPVGFRVITADSWGDFGAWDQRIEVEEGKDHFVLIKARSAPVVAHALLGVVGTLAEAAAATESKSGPFELELVDAVRGQEERSKLAFYREGHPPIPGESVAAPMPEQPTQPVLKSQTVLSPAVSEKRREEVKVTGGVASCSVEQVLSMKSAGLKDGQIRAACK